MKDGTTLIDELKDRVHDQHEEIKRLNGLINTMLEFNLFGEECPLNLGYTERCDEENKMYFMKMTIAKKLVMTILKSVG